LINIIDSTIDSTNNQSSTSEEAKESFWYWNDFKTYLIYIGKFTAVVGLLTAAFNSFPLFVVTVGFLSSGVEALLGIPQFLLNFQKRSTAGLAYAFQS
jgi:hypothetical protein